MNRIADRDVVFLNEMGLGPLWQLRAAAGQAVTTEAVFEDAGVALAEAPVGEAVPAPAGAPVPSPVAAPVLARQPAPSQPPQSTQPPPQSPVQKEPAPPRPPGPSPLQRVAQSVSALEPVAPPPDAESAWDDAALPRDATPEEIAGMDWDQLAVAISSCRRCSACRDGRPPVPGTGARTARWLVAAGASTAADEKARLPLAGDPGKLLDNMLAAVGMGRERDVYITNLIKCRPTTSNGGERAPAAAEAAACRPYLERELALTGAGTVLTLGQIAANTLLGRPLQESLAGARGAVHALGRAQMAGQEAGQEAGQRTGQDAGQETGKGAVMLVATLHPGELLRRGADKALAWADLCRARSAMKDAGAGPA